MRDGANASSWTANLCAAPSRRGGRARAAMLAATGLAQRARRNHRASDVCRAARSLSVGAGSRPRAFPFCLARRAAQVRRLLPSGRRESLAEKSRLAKGGHDCRHDGPAAQAGVHLATANHAYVLAATPSSLEQSAGFFAVAQCWLAAQPALLRGRVPACGGRGGGGLARTPLDDARAVGPCILCGRKAAYRP